MWRSENVRNCLFEVIAHKDNLVAVIFDLETTGFSPDKNHIIQIAAHKLQVNEGRFDSVAEFSTYINPGYSLPPRITEITGINDTTLVNAPTENEVFHKIDDFFRDADVVIIYNSPFDTSFMKAMYSRHNKDFNFRYNLDVLEMARDIVPKSESPTHKLGDIASLYGVDRGLTFHNAMDDVMATLRLLRVFVVEYQSMSRSSCAKKQATVHTVHYWAGYRGKSRIYVQTNIGSFYYDIMSKTWGKKGDNPNSLDEVDMEQLRKDVFRKTGTSDERELARYRG